MVRLLPQTSANFLFSGFFLRPSRSSDTFGVVLTLDFCFFGKIIKIFSFPRIFCRSTFELILMHLFGAAFLNEKGRECFFCNQLVRTNTNSWLVDFSFKKPCLVIKPMLFSSCSARPSLAKDQTTSIRCSGIRICLDRVQKNKDRRLIGSVCKAPLTSTRNYLSSSKCLRWSLSLDNFAGPTCCEPNAHGKVKQNALSLS